MSAQEQLVAVNAAGRITTERRNGPDRRSHNLRTLTYCGLHGRGRRRHLRRQDQSYYLDYYDPRIVMTGLLVLFLSCLDAMFTLTLLGRGAYEANYFMAELLRIGDAVFIVTKVGITAVGITFLMMHAHFRILRVTSGRRMLQLLAGVYGLLIAWELFLLGSI